VFRGGHPAVAIRSENAEYVCDFFQPAEPDPLAQPPFQHADVVNRTKAESTSEVALSKAS
jgi:hypothetical protein